MNRKYFEDVCDGVTIIPYQMHAPITREIELKGWPMPITVTMEDKTLDEISQLCAKILKSFLDMYKNEYVFREPCFYWNPEKNCAGIRIGMLEKDEYEKAKMNSNLQKII